jgi:hypothetical protein
MSRVQTPVPQKEKRERERERERERNNYTQNKISFPRTLTSLPDSLRTEYKDDYHSTMAY